MFCMIFRVVRGCNVRVVGVVWFLVWFVGWVIYVIIFLVLLCKLCSVMYLID